MTLYVDARWRGMHGIARFSSNVVKSLDVPHVLLDGQLSPTSPLDVAWLGRVAPRRSDVLFTPGFNAGVCRAPQVLTVHDLIHLRNSEVSPQKRAYYGMVVKPAVQHAGLVFTVSDASRVAIREWLAEDTTDVVVAGNGVSSVFTPSDRATRPGQPSFVCVSNTKPHKNVERLLRALALRPDYRLTLVVPRDQVGNAEALAGELGVKQAVAVATNLTDAEMRDLYTESHGLVLPSLEEGFGLPVAEATACGAPVAYWRGCVGTHEIADPTRSVIVADAHDEAAWADALDELLAKGHGEPDLLWRERMTWSAVAERVSGALRRHFGSGLDAGSDE